MKLPTSRRRQPRPAGPAHRQPVLPAIRAGAARRPRWDDEKDKAADLIIDTVDEARPQFPASRSSRAQIHSPLDLERKFGLIGGDIMHGHMSLDQLWAARPVLGHGDYRGPIKGLYMCGAGTHPGGGVTGAPGHNAAHEILRDRSIVGRLFALIRPACAAWRQDVTAPTDTPAARAASAPSPTDRPSARRPHTIHSTNPAATAAAITSGTSFGNSLIAARRALPDRRPCPRRQADRRDDPGTAGRSCWYSCSSITPVDQHARDEMRPRPGCRGGSPCRTRPGTRRPRHRRSGTSPCSMMKPLSAPNALIAANSATTCAMPVPRVRPRNSAIGAGEAAVISAGISSATDAADERNRPGRSARCRSA